MDRGVGPAAGRAGRTPAAPDPRWSPVRGRAPRRPARRPDRAAAEGGGAAHQRGGDGGGPGPGCPGRHGVVVVRPRRGHAGRAGGRGPGRPAATPGGRRRPSAAWPPRVRQHAPEFVVYAGRPEEASYQVEMWLPYLKRTGRSFMVITRAEQPAQTLAALTDVPVVCCATVAELEQVLVPTLTTVFYVNAASANGQMVRYSHLTHVHLGSRRLRQGDVVQPAARHVRQGVLRRPRGDPALRRERCLDPAGTGSASWAVPQLEAVERATAAIGAVDVPTVLYAPTWRGHVEETRLYSLPAGRADRRGAAGTGRAGDLPAAPVQPGLPRGRRDGRADRRAAAGRQGEHRTPARVG